tara:strand:- start:829 stop:2292 length:1464 start_codon:yes stop_codon:yes gene_type:complete
MSTNVDIEFLDYLKEHSVALRLLRSPHLPLIGSFFHAAFLRHNRRSVSYQELIALLDHHLSDIAETYGEDAYPKTAKAYIDDWINTKGGYLRKYLPAQGDEPECDLLPDVEKALRWVEELQGKRFVGTESRLKLLLDMIADLVHGTSEDTASKLATLKQRKAEIEQQIELVELGQDLGYNATQVREKMYLLTDVSRQLLGDFRQVEANFRDLDKDTRKKITIGGLHKGKVLDTVFNNQDVIDNSDEGKSFSAFFELLMRGDMRESMRDNLKQLLNQEHSRDFVKSDEMLQHLYGYLLDAGAKVNGTKQQITDQLRRYIQDQSQDNKRILELIREFEALAQQSDDDQLQPKDFCQLDSFQVDIYQQLSRNLYQPKAQETFDCELVEQDRQPDVDLSRLFEICHIDEQALQRQIAQCLQAHHGQVTLAQVIEQHPLQYGLDEALTYVKLACEQQVASHIDEQKSQTISWQHGDHQKRLKLPHITFVREL